MTDDTTPPHRERLSPSLQSILVGADALFHLIYLIRQPRTHHEIKHILNGGDLGHEPNPLAGRIKHNGDTHCDGIHTMYPVDLLSSDRVLSSRFSLRFKPVSENSATPRGIAYFAQHRVGEQQKSGVPLLREDTPYYLLAHVAHLPLPHITYRSVVDHFFALYEQLPPQLRKNGDCKSGFLTSEVQLRIAYPIEARAGANTKRSILLPNTITIRESHRHVDLEYTLGLVPIP